MLSLSLERAASLIHAFTHIQPADMVSNHVLVADSCSGSFGAENGLRRRMVDEMEPAGPNDGMLNITKCNKCYRPVVPSQDCNGLSIRVWEAFIHRCDGGSTAGACCCMGHRLILVAQATLSSTDCQKISKASKAVLTLQSSKTERWGALSICPRQSWATWNKWQRYANSSFILAMSIRHFQAAITQLISPSRAC